MDALIARYGVPAFAKIDVEGCEPAVLGGLSQPLPALSFEFHPHLLEPAFLSVRRLCELADWRMNIANGEQFSCELEDWVAPAEMLGVFESLRRRS